METVEKNKLIAEFMNAKIAENRYSHESSDYYFESSELEYHTSWNWLMPVIEEITFIEYESPLIDNIFSAIKSVNISNTYDEVVKFILWYNKNK